MTKEALQIALEALTDFDYDKRMSAIESIKEALETKDEPVGKFAKFTDGIWKEVTDYSAGIPLYTTPQRTWVGLTELDCVGWFGYDTGLRLWFETNKGDDGAIPLYKDQQQRTWVGLTEEDLKPICDEWHIVYGAWVNDFARDIESKLKEKNT